MKNITIIIAYILLPAYLFSQNTFKKNDLYLEAAGNGLFGSLNYERQLSKEPGIGIRLGIGFYSENAFYLTIPVGINYLVLLKDNHSFIDAGMGITFTNKDSKIFIGSKNTSANNFVNFIPSVGYRRHTKNNLMLKIAITPIINKYTFFPWAGIALGKRF